MHKEAKRVYLRLHLGHNLSKEMVGVDRPKISKVLTREMHPKCMVACLESLGSALDQAVRTDGPSWPRPAASLSTRAGPTPPAFPAAGITSGWEHLTPLTQYFSPRSFFFSSSPKDIFVAFYREREGEKETLICCLPKMPHPGTKPTA